MLVGEVAWQSGVAAPDVLRRLEHVPVQSIAIPEPPPELSALLAKCFAFEPANRPEDFRSLADLLVDIYQSHAVEDWFRKFPEATRLQADALNNRAVSMLDLGRVEEAENLFKGALAIDPGHLESKYNLGLYRWRSGQMTDLELVSELEQVPQSEKGAWSLPVLIGQVHLERCNGESAARAFEAAIAVGGRANVSEPLTDAATSQETSLKCVRTIVKGTQDIESVSLGPDGTLALTAGGSPVGPRKDYRIRLWDLKSGRCIRTFDGHHTTVRATAMSTDGRWVISGCGYGQLLLWDSASGYRRQSFEGHTGGIKSIVLNDHGNRILSGSNDKTMRLWDVETGRCIAVFSGHSESVNSVTFSRNGHLLISGSQDKTIRFWDSNTGRCVRELAGHREGIASLALSSDGQTIVSGSWDGTLRLWDFSSGKCIRVLVGHADAVLSVAFCPGGNWAVSGSRDGTLRLWEVNTGRCARTLTGHRKSIQSMAVSGDGRWAVSGSADDTLRVWNIGALTSNRNYSAPLSISRIAGAEVLRALHDQFKALLSCGGQKLAEGNYSEALELTEQARSIKGFARNRDALDLWNRVGLHCTRASLRSAWPVAKMKSDGAFYGQVDLSGDGRIAVSCAQVLKLWDVCSGACVHSFSGHEGQVAAAIFTSKGDQILSGGFDGTLRLWDTSNRRLVRIFEDHADRVCCIHLSPDDRWALSGHSNGSGDNLRLWDLMSGKLLRSWNGHQSTIESVGFSADGRSLFSFGANNVTEQWELESGRSIRIFKNIPIGPYAGGDGRFSSHHLFVPSKVGHSAIRVSGARTLELWNTDTGSCIRAFEPHKGLITTCAMSRDGRWAFSAGRDNSMRLWDSTSGDCVWQYSTHQTVVTSAVFSADSRWLFIRTSEGNLHLWEIEWAFMVQDPADWDERVRPHLEKFLILHTPYASTDPSRPEFLMRRGRPTWTEEDTTGLLQTLQYAGYGWLRPEGVLCELDNMAARWDGLPPVPWEASD